MNPTQARAIHLVTEGVNALSDALVDELDIDEAMALDIVRGLPNLTSELQEGNIKALYERAWSQARKTINSPDNPKEYFFTHPRYQPMTTSPDQFNAHMAQAMSPYVLAIARKIAKDRGLEDPNEADIKKALQSVDWAKAAYEAKSMPKKPPPGKMRQWFNKYIFGPLGKALDLPYEQLFALTVALPAMWMLYHAFWNYTAKYGQPVIDAMIKGVDWYVNR